ncbi:MAG: AAA family ATPase, partial [Brevinema sp.]
MINILVTHYFIQPEPSNDLYQETLEEDESERATLGTIGAASLSAVPEGIDYLILGHIHRPYSLYSSRRIKAFYTGSPLPYSIKETSYQKSILMLDLKKKLEYRIPLSVSRTIKEIVFDTFDTIFERLEEEKEHYVLLKWVGDRYFTAEENRQLRESHSRILRIESYAQVEYQGFSNIGTEDAQKEDPRELFEEYFFSKNKQKAPEDLLAVFDEVLSEDREELQLIRKQGFYPNKLSIEGFYSYKNRVDIDFSIFDGKNFFGVFGAVGSGKSAIIEAIIFALYGKVQRLGNIGAKLGQQRFSTSYGMMNLEATNMMIEFTFEIIGLDGKEEYCARIIAKRDKKDLSKVTTIREILINKSGNFEPFECDLKEAGEQILGISYDDFRKTIILQQRDFDSFLNLSATDSSETLKRLFQLHRFDLSNSVDPLLTDASKKISTLEGELNHLEYAADEYVETLESEEQDCRTRVESQKIIFEAKQSEYDRLKELEEHQKRLDEIIQIRSHLLSQKELFDQAKKRNDIQPIVDAITNIQHLQKQSEDLIQKSERAQRDLALAEENKQQFDALDQDLIANIDNIKNNLLTLKKDQDQVADELLVISPKIGVLQQTMNSL